MTEQTAIDGRRTRPAHICRQLLATLDVSEGRRRRRKRNTSPDSIGMAIKRGLLQETVREDPDPDAFEGWLLQRSLSGVGPQGCDRQLFEASGPVRAMALEILAELRLAEVPGPFQDWLTKGAPSDDVGTSP
jgi:hypothetical protein